MFKRMNKKFVNIFALCSFITFITLTATFIILGRLEYNRNNAIYNISRINATSYDSELLDCDTCDYTLCSPKPYTGIVYGEYYAWDSKHIEKLYKKRLIVINNICGINFNDTIKNAHIKWPIGTTRPINYLISDPNTIESDVPRGELHIVGAVSMGIMTILVVIIYIVWYKRRQESWYQMVEYKN